MAKAKNPKRVAAGKKAARTRAKGKGRSRFRGKNSGRTKKRHTRGISGRIGAVILGVVPPLIAGVDAVGVTNSVRKRKDLDAPSTLLYGMSRWLNNLTNGFLGTVAFEAVWLGDKKGARFKEPVGAGLPKGSLWAVAGTGLLLMFYDAVAAKLAGGAVKIPFTGINATGN